MKLLSYNTLFAGFDGANNSRQSLQHEVIREIQPDILLMQEAKGFELEGGRRLFETEKALGMRGLLGVAPRTGQNTAIFFRQEIKPLFFQSDTHNFHHVASAAQFSLPGFDEPVTFVSVHLTPVSPVLRRLEASHLIQYAAPSRLALIGGDFNSVSPNDLEPTGWESLPAHFRARYLLPGAQTADRETVGTLLSAGMVDVAHRLGAHRETTVPTTDFAGAEFIPFRCDHLLATPRLAELASGYEVIKDARTGRASDHYPVLVTFTPRSISADHKI